MNQNYLITKRWLCYFLLFFLVWYPVSFVLLTAYQVFGGAVMSIALNVWTPLWALLASYLYFRRAQNDWPSRFFTAFGWMILMFIFAALLVKPMYGYDWTSIVNLPTINANWINVIAILVGSLAAAKSPSEA